MHPEEVEAKLLAALALGLANTHGVGSLPTARLVAVAGESFGVPEQDALLALDRLAERGRLLERDGAWTVRPVAGMR